MFVQAQKLPGASRTFRKSLHPANKYVIVITFTKKDITSYLMSKARLAVNTCFKSLF